MPVETLSQPEFCDFVTPVADSLADSNSEELIREGWKRTQNLLLDWMTKGVPDLDSELIPPSKEAICECLNITAKMNKTLALPPTRVLPNGEGGVVFELFVSNHGRQTLEKIEVQENREAQITVFFDSELQFTKPFQSSNSMLR